MLFVDDATARKKIIARMESYLDAPNACLMRFYSYLGELARFFIQA